MFQKLLKKLAKSQKGFTLIELIVVIAILGILAAILIPTISGFVGSARDQAGSADANTVFTAYQLALTDLNNSNTTGAAIDKDKVAKEAAGYMPSIASNVLTGTSADGKSTAGITYNADMTAVTGVTIIENGKAYVYPKTSTTNP